MVAFICYFFPAVLALWLFETLKGSSLRIKECIYRYCVYVLAINFMCFAIKKFILNTANYAMVYDKCDMIPSVAFNYILMSVFLAVMLAVFEVLISKKVKVTVEEIKYDKENN